MQISKLSWGELVSILCNRARSIECFTEDNIKSLSQIVEAMREKNRRIKEDPDDA